MPQTQSSSFLEITNEDFTSPTNVKNSIIQNTDIHPIETKLLENDGILEVGEIDVE